MQPGVASVQCAILQKAPGSVSFHLCQFNSLEGQEYEDVRRRFSGAVVCGIVRKNSFVPILNPAADEKMEAGDRIIALAPQGDLPAWRFFQHGQCADSARSSVRQADKQHDQAFPRQKGRAWASMVSTPESSWSQ